MCDYVLEPGAKCPLERYADSPFCILHTPFPDDKGSVEYKRLLELKNIQIQNKIESGDFDFRGVFIDDFRLPDYFQLEGFARFEGATIERSAWFDGATIKGAAWFDGATIKGSARFDHATIEIGARFTGATIKGGAGFTGATIKGDAEFTDATIERSAWFDRATIKGSAWFDRATIKGPARFDRATIEGPARFKGATIEGPARFKGATIEGDAWFTGATIKGDGNFQNAKIKGSVFFDNAIIQEEGIQKDEENEEKKLSFSGSKIDGDARFDNARIYGKVKFGGTNIGQTVSFVGTHIADETVFDGATIVGNAHFKGNSNKEGQIVGDIHLIGAKFLGKLDFEELFFENLHAREQICRYAKRLFEERGEKHDADKYFFKEMVYRRGQKRWRETEGKPIKERVIKWFRYWIEWPLENLFFYGVHPEYSFIIWISIIAVFAIVYWLGAMVEASNFGGYLYFSVTNAMTPGYGGMNPKPGWPQYIATIEAIFGTFMWASFIAILARKFSR